MGNSWRQQCAGCWARGDGQRAWEEQPSASHNCSHVVVPEGLRPSILVSPLAQLTLLQPMGRLRGEQLR